MATTKKVKFYNFIFIAVIVLLIIPQTRQPIQVFIHKGIAFIVKPSVIKTSERVKLSNYNWTLRDISGNDFDFNTAKGKVVVINFWATWCPPCIAEMPSLNALQEHYKAREDIVFLYVSNEEQEVISEFIKRKQFQFNAYMPLTAYPEIFEVRSIPRTFILDKNGAIVVDKTGAADWNSEKIKSLIDGLLTMF